MNRLECNDLIIDTYFSTLKFSGSDKLVDMGKLEKIYQSQRVEIIANEEGGKRNE